MRWKLNNSNNSNNNSGVLECPFSGEPSARTFHNRALSLSLSLCLCLCVSVCLSLSLSVSVCDFVRNIKWLLSLPILMQESLW